MVRTWSSGGWRSKLWNVDSDTGTQVTSWDSVTVLHNEPEMVLVRLTKALNPGRCTLDLTVRRGGRLVEGYLKRGTAATLTVRLAAAENFTATASGGYITATADDGDGNRFVAGSARNFTPHASGGVVKASTTALDFFVGQVVNGTSPVSGDEATALRNQYIGALPEAVFGVRR